MERDLAWHVRPPASVCVWRRLANRGLSMGELPLRETPQPTQRTVEDHWIAVEVVDEAGAPVSGVQLQLVSAGGDVTPLSTDRDGKARADRIQAGRVELSLPQLDLSMWTVDGQEPEPMSADQRFRWHTVVQGECLSKIAHRYGVKSYKLLWDHPKNADLRKKRKSPHVLLPGDLVAVPAVRQGSVTRPTDSTVHVVVGGALEEFRVVLQDHNQLPFKQQTYELCTEPALPDGARTGTTDGSGKLVERVPVGTERLIVRLPAIGLSWTFKASALAAIPGAEERGRAQGAPGRATQSSPAVLAVQQRLNALGFPAGPEDGRLGPRTEAALALFTGQPPAGAQPPPHAEPADDERALALAEIEKAYTV